MAINQLSTSNTFQHWLIATQQLITLANTLTDGGSGSEFIVNTRLTVLDTLNTRNILTQTLNVSSLATINVLQANTITTNVANVNVIRFSDNTTLNSNSFIISITNSATEAYSIANAAFDKANSANVLAQAAFDRANLSSNLNATNDTTTSSLYPVMVNAAGSEQTPKVSTTKFAFDAVNGRLGVNLTGTPPTSTLDVGGNLNFTGSSRRITGDFSSSPASALRTAFQTNATNNGTGVFAIPSGTASYAGYAIFSSSSVTDCVLGEFSTNGSRVLISSSIRGAYSYQNMVFATGGSTSMTLTSDARLGIGETNPVYGKVEIKDASPIEGKTRLIIKTQSSTISDAPEVLFWRTDALGGPPASNSNFGQIAWRAVGGLAGTYDHASINVSCTSIPAGSGGAPTAMRFSILDDPSGTVPVENFRIDKNDVTILGSSRRIRADFTSATGSNRDARTFFQTSTPDGATSVGIISNGTANYSDVAIYGTNSSNNSPLLLMFCSQALGYNKIASLKTGTGTALPLIVEMNGSDVMYISATNNAVGVGTTDPQGTFHANGTFYYTNAPSGSGTSLLVGSSGEVRKFSSSLRYKYDIEDYYKGLNTVMSLRPVSFKYNGEERKNIGFIAEEIDALGLNEIVVYDQENLPESVSYANMVALLTKAIQELKTELDSVKSEIKTIKGE